MWYNMEVISHKKAAAMRQHPAARVTRLELVTMNDSTPIPQGFKRCSRRHDCKHPNGPVLPATSEYFKREKRSSSGLAARCKACDRAWRQANAEKLSVKRKRYYEENRERELENNRRYHQRHKEEIHARHAEYRKTAAFKKSKRKHAYKPDVYAKELQRTKLRYHIRRRGNPKTPSDMTHELWQQALDYFEHCCAVCGRPVGLWHTLAIDHWVPMSKGGQSNLNNLVPLCHGLDGCNNSKKDKMPNRWLVEKFGKKKATKIRQRIEEYFEWAKENS